MNTPETLSNYALAVYAFMRDQYIREGYAGGGRLSAYTDPPPCDIPSGGWLGITLNKLAQAGYVALLSRHDPSTYVLALPIRYGLTHQHNLDQAWRDSSQPRPQIDEEIRLVTIGMEMLCVELAERLIALKEHKDPEKFTGYEVILPINKNEYKGIYGPTFQSDAQAHLTELRADTKELLLTLFKTACPESCYESMAESLLPITRVEGRPGGTYRVDRWVFSCLPFPRPRFTGYRIRDVTVRSDQTGEGLRAKAEPWHLSIAYTLRKTVITFSQKCFNDQEDRV